MGNNPVYQGRSCGRLVTPDVWCGACGHCADDCRCREDSVRLDLEANGEYLA